MKKRVLFLCNGNSCRSQMAEAIINARFSGAWEASSAGTRPAGYVHPLAVTALREIGIAHSGRSKPVDELIHQQFDLVVTVCDEANENCPLWLGKGKRIHSGFEDPARAEGDDQRKLAAFRLVRDQILDRIPEILQSY